jgi:hypothetical protein
VAAALLLGAAVGMAWLRASSDQFWIELGFNLFAAWAAFGFLHFRWRARERREITPDKARDIFS